jgi:hypothetical protein
VQELQSLTFKTPLMEAEGKMILENLQWIERGMIVLAKENRKTNTLTELD